MGTPSAPSIEDVHNLRRTLHEAQTDSTADHAHVQQIVRDWASNFSGVNVQGMTDAAFHFKNEHTFGGFNNQFSQVLQAGGIPDPGMTAEEGLNVLSIIISNVSAGEGWASKDNPVEIITNFEQTYGVSLDGLKAIAMGGDYPADENMRTTPALVLQEIAIDLGIDTHEEGWEQKLTTFVQESEYASRQIAVANEGDMSGPTASTPTMGG